MNFSLSVEKITPGILDVVGKMVIVNPNGKKKLDNFTAVWRKSIPAMQQNTIDVWAQGQSTWMPLRQGYIDWKAKQGFSTDKNVRKGQMKEALQYGQINEMAPMVWAYGIDQTDSRWIEGKSRTPYPEEANKKRPFMVMTKKLIDAVQENMKNYILKLFKGQI